MDRSRHVLVRVVAVAIPLVLVSGTAAATIISAHIRGVVIQSSGETVAAGAASLASPCIEHIIGEHDPEAVGASRCTVLADAVRQRQDRGLLHAYRLLDVDGTVVYSTDPSEIGSHLDIEGFDSALGGAVMVHVVDPEDDAILSVVDDRVLRVLAPVRKGESGPVLAVAESLKPYGPIAKTVQESALVAWVSVGLGAVVTSVAIGFVGWRATIELREEEQLTATLNERLQRSLLDIEAQSLGVLQALSAAVDARDQYTSRHSLGATEMAFRVGRTLGLDPGSLTTLERAALLHDVGKIGVPEGLLLKPAALTPAEFDRVKEHSEAGARILETIPFLADAVPIVRHHHERWDGTGYPQGLAGVEIPLLARVLAVADTYDAMVSERPYRQPMRREVAIDEIRRCAGTQFDPEVVEAFLRAVGDEKLRAAS